MLSKEDRVLIKVLRFEKGYGAKKNNFYNFSINFKQSTVTLFQQTATVFVHCIFGWYYFEFNF